MRGWGTMAVLVLGWALTAEADVITIPWDMGYEYKTYNVKCGDSLRFVWANGVHGVRLMAPGHATDCIFEGAIANGLGRVTQGPDELTFPVTKEGTFNYGCPVAEHCQAGMLVEVKVQGGTCSSSNRRILRSLPSERQAKASLPAAF